jgi:hypothetical protein
MAERQQPDTPLWGDELDSMVDLPEPLAIVKATLDRIKADILVTTGLRLSFFVLGPGPDGEYECGPGWLVTLYPGDDIEAFTAEVADEQSG